MSELLLTLLAEHWPELVEQTILSVAGKLTVYALSKLATTIKNKIKAKRRPKSKDSDVL